MALIGHPRQRSARSCCRRCCWSSAACRRCTSSPRTTNSSRRTGPRENAVIQAVHEVWAPLLISAVHDGGRLRRPRPSAGSRGRDLGLMAVIGVLLLTISSLGYLPAALAVWVAGREQQRDRAVAARRQPDGQPRPAGLRGARHGAGRWPRVIAVVAVIGAWRIVVDSDFLGYFDPDSPVRRDHELINQQIVGSNPFYLIVEGGAPGAMRRWEVLQEDQGSADLRRHAAGHQRLDLDRRLSRAAREGTQQDGRGRHPRRRQGQGHRGRRTPQSFWENPANLPAGAQPHRRQPEHVQGGGQPRLLARQHRRALEGLRLARDRVDAAADPRLRRRELPRRAAGRADRQPGADHRHELAASSSIRSRASRWRCS